MSGYDETISDYYIQKTEKKVKKKEKKRDK